MKRASAILFLAVLIPACGGGGSGFSPVVIFQADKVTDGQTELFAANAAGATILLSGVTPPGEQVSTHKTAPDGSAVAFLSDRDGDNDDELYVVRSSGGVPVEVSGADGDVRHFFWSPDSTRLAYTAQPDVGPIELYVASATSPRVKVSGTMVAGGNVFLFQWSPTSARLSYMATQTAPTNFEIWTVLPDGTGLLKVSGTHAGSGANGGVWSPDGSRVAYAADGEVWTAPGGSAAANISVSGAVVGSVDPDYGLLWAPNSTRIAYVASQITAGVYELFTADGDTADSAVKISGPMAVNGDVYKPLVVVEGPQPIPVQWMPDSSFVLYLADQDVNDQVELYAAPAALAGEDQRISRAMGASGQVRLFSISPDSQWAAYLADETGGGVDELLTVQRGTADVDLVSGPLVTGGDVHDFRWHPQQAALLYSADQEVDDHVELYRVLPGTTAASVKVSGPMIAGGTVVQFEWAPDGSAIFYLADQDVNETVEVFRSNPDGSGNLRVSGPQVAGGDAVVFSPLP